MYLIQDVQILMNSWMIHALKLENLNQIFQHHVNNISHSHRLGAIKYSESAVSLLPGVLLGIVMLLLTVEHCTPVKITSISLIQYLPDGCSEYMVVTRDSTYT